MTNFEDDPAAALRMVQETQAKAAMRATAPVWYHPALGAIIATLVASMEAPRFSGGLIAVSMCGLAILVTQYQKHTGVWPNGLTAGGPRTRRLMVFGLLAMMAVLFGGARLKFGYGLDGALIAAGILIGLFATWYGFAWERAFRRDAGVSQ
ncbi:MAG: hypothetical protein M3Q15_04055 [Pseudomonadota bacterium]|nr:hypothetical protein [Pseudomonadota bacterium]